METGRVDRALDQDEPAIGEMLVHHKARPPENEQASARVPRDTTVIQTEGRTSNSACRGEANTVTVP